MSKMLNLASILPLAYNHFHIDFRNILNTQGTWMNNACKDINILV